MEELFISQTLFFLGVERKINILTLEKMRNKHGEERFEVIFRDGSGLKDEGVRQIPVCLTEHKNRIPKIRPLTGRTMRKVGGLFLSPKSKKEVKHNGKTENP